MSEVPPRDQAHAGEKIGGHPLRFLRSVMSRISAGLAAEHVCHPYGTASAWRRASREGGAAAIVEHYSCPECGQLWTAADSGPPAAPAAPSTDGRT